MPRGSVTAGVVAVATDCQSVFAQAGPEVAESLRLRFEVSNKSFAFRSEAFMSKRAVTLLFVAGSLVAGSATAQTSPTPSQQTGATTQQGPVPLFRVTVVGHTTPAINYRPRKGDTKIDFRGTTLMPLALGNAKVQGKKGYIDIDAKFDRLASPTQFGPEYLTYVLWAVTPEGRATNLGEVQVNDDEARIHVTTELQAFGMIVTAEPYFAVTQPSDVVVMENSVREGTKGISKSSRPSTNC
jgi:hypothetical protein